MAYATQFDVAKFLYNDETATDKLPDDIDRKISRAEELINEIMLNNYESENTEHQEAAKKATCAQIEYWLAIDEEIDIVNYSGNMEIGNLSMNMDSIGKLAPRVKRILYNAGLLYSGLSGGATYDAKYFT